MIEFGSDFHLCDLPFHGQTTIHTLFRSPLFYTSGRMALKALVDQEGWKRMWVPAYFCHEIVTYWKQSIDICLYDDYPLEENDDQIVRSLPFQKGDALLRMNFFGLRAKRSNSGIPVPVIEDHSHALSSNWALHSDADWCFASLRKSLPLAFGGIVWSPKNHLLPDSPKQDPVFEQLAANRYEAMSMKTHYLANGGNKETFRNLFISTEEGLEHISNIADMDSQSKRILQHLDILRWNEQKRTNWNVACFELKNFTIVGREQQLETPFSIIILMPDKQSRDRFKSFLVQHNIFPATLWNIPQEVEPGRCKDFGNRMVSLHCDARYTKQEIQQMCQIINQYDTNR